MHIYIHHILCIARNLLNLIYLISFKVSFKLIIILFYTSSCLIDRPEIYVKILLYNQLSKILLCLVYINKTYIGRFLMTTV